MNTRKWLFYSAAVAFLMALPFIWIVAGLAANLRQFHPVAGWAVWIATTLALGVLFFPILRFLRLPTMPDSGLFGDVPSVQSDGAWREAAQLLLQTSDDADAAAKLRRFIQDMPNDLPKAVREEIERRKGRATELRYATVKQAVLLAVLTPHRKLEVFILLWLNLRQVFLLGKCFGFKPSPRGIFRLYSGVFVSALLVEAIDEVSEPALAHGFAKLSDSLPFIREATALAYEGIRAAAYVGFIGLLADYLLRHQLKRTGSSERKALRQTAWQKALEAAKDIQPWTTRASATEPT
ncbi:MAG: hypothetical protein WCK17_17125 [Verrucomicrobiota bacterium]